MQVARCITRATPFWSNDFDQIAYSRCINRPKEGELSFDTMVSRGFARR